MKILLTGASGFIGGAFMRRFEDLAGVELFGVARRPTALRRYARIDLSRPFDVPFRPDVVIHAAALASPWGSAAEFRRQNVEATANVVRFCEEHGRPKLVYVSSSSVFYRREHQLLLDESSPIGPRFINDYAAGKYGGELAVGAYAGPSVILRPRAVFGPGDTVMFPRILAAARVGRIPLFTQPGPPAVGDLIYIDNLTDMMYAAAVRDEISGAFNLTNAQPVPIQDFLLRILARLDIPAPNRRVSVATAMRAAWATETVYRLLRLRAEPPITRFGVSVFAYSKTFDVRRMLQVFGTPTVSLDEGVERFVAWQRSLA